MGPWPNSWTHRVEPVTPASPEEGPWTWLSMTQVQQRALAQWMQAGQTWLQWWASSLPTMPWPPAGQVLPPVDAPAKPSHHDELHAAAQVAAHAHEPVRAASKRRLTAKSKGARHH